MKTTKEIYKKRQKAFSGAMNKIENGKDKVMNDIAFILSKTTQTVYNKRKGKYPIFDGEYASIISYFLQRHNIKLKKF